MKSSAKKVELASADDLFSTEESRQDATLERVQQIALSELYSFPDHPFSIRDDDSMKETVESVKEYGILTPAIARPRADGGYELLSGHRRKRACELAGLDTMPVIVRDLDMDTAIIFMVDSNIQRENILPSEKAFAYRMKLEAMKHQGKHSKATSVPVAQKLGGKTSRELLGEQVGESQDQIRRYIRLTYLLPALLQMVDDNKLALRSAVEVSALAKEEQELLISTMNRLTVIPTLEQAQRLKAYSQNGQLNADAIDDVLAEKKPGTEQITLKKKCLSQYFPKEYTQQQMEEVILSLLETWKSQQKGVTTNDSDG